MTGPRPDTDDFASLFREGIALLDVRAPVEFAKGSFPTAINIPLLNDEERAAVGTAYVQEGQQAAITLGHQLVNGATKDARVAAWRDFAQAHPNGYLFCFRGGLRSKITQQWLAEAGIDYPRVQGGYKAMRRFLIDALEDIVAKRDFIVISGHTGTGKTTVLNQLPRAVDLEGMANHRGSSFGGRIGGQPSQIDFENALAIRLLQLDDGDDNKGNDSGPLFIEDESRLVGRCALPQYLIDKIMTAPTVVLEETMENRISAVQKDYVTDLAAEYEATYGADGFAKFTDFLRQSLYRIRKRLGPQRYKDASAALEAALAAQAESGDTALHRQWIGDLLTQYYDPMYAYQMERRETRPIFTGDAAAVLAFCRGA